MAKRKGKREVLTPLIAGQMDLTAKGTLRYRKQILPITTIDYDGTSVNFDQKYHDKLLAAYEQGAYPKIPFVLADDNNKHVEHAESFRGMVRKVERAQPGENPGLYAEIEFPNKRAAKAVLDNSELGVSCRILENVEKNGTIYPAAIRHVCGTLFERVEGMSPWEAVDLSEYSSARTVVDLTSVTYKEESMAKSATKKSKKADDDQIDLSEVAKEIEAMDDDELRAWVGEVLDLSDDVDDEDDEDDEDEDVIDDEDDEDSDDEDDEDDDDEEDEEDEDEPKGKGKKGKKDLSDKRSSRAIDLADARAQAAQANADRALEMLSDQRWETDKEKLLRKGIPAKIVDLAEPFLHSTESVVIDLTAGDDAGKRLNATSRVRKILDEIVGLELNEPKGHGVDLSDDASDPKNAKVKATLDAWTEQYDNG